MATRAQFDVVFYPVTPRDIYAGRVLCLPIPEAIIPYLIAALEPYTYPDAYKGEPDENRLTAIQVDHFRATIAAKETCEGETIKVEVPAKNLGGGISLECEAEMGSCITNITIENGIMYLWYGACCKVPVGDVGGLISPGGFSDPTTIPEPDPEVVDASCRKASIITDTLWDMANVYYDAWITYLGTGYFAYQALKSAYPYVSWDYADLIVANGILAASVLVGFDVDYSEEEQQTLKCALMNSYDDTYTLSDDEFSNTKSQIRSALNVLSQEYLVAIYNSAGPGDWKTIAQQSALLTEEPDCDCPTVANPLSVPGPNGWYLVPLAADCHTSGAGGSAKWWGSGFTTTPTQDLFGIAFDVVIGTATHITPVNQGHFITGEDLGQICGTFDNGHQDGNLDSSTTITQLNRVCHGVGVGFQEKFGEGTYNLLANGRTWNVNPATPDLPVGNTVDWYWRASPFQSGFTLEFNNIYMLYNTNSPSHSA